MKILILGHTGMLGHTVFDYFTRKSFSVELIKERWPSEKFVRSILTFDGDYIVNCIGAIPQRINKFEINYDLPIWLDKNANCKIIHQDTDSTSEESEYGFSKNQAANYIIKNGVRTKMLKTSIIGHDKNNVCLLDWFLRSKGSVFGYVDYYSNGNTTLEWAKQVYNMMFNWNIYNDCTTISTECISKYKLLTLFKDVYKKDIIINKKSHIKINRCLIGDIKVSSLKKQLQELREFYDN